MYYIRRFLLVLVLLLPLKIGATDTRILNRDFSLGNQPSLRYNFGGMGLLSPQKVKKIAVRVIKYESCQSPQPIDLHYLNISSTPTGDGKLNLHFSVKKELHSPILGSIELLKKAFGTWVKMPCIGNAYGSCRYANLCSLGYEKCPLPSLENEKIPCGCPITTGEYVIRNQDFPLPEMQSASMLTGEYRFKIMIKSAKNEPLGCYTGEGTVLVI